MQGEENESKTFNKTRTIEHLSHQEQSLVLLGQCPLFCLSLLFTKGWVSQLSSFCYNKIFGIEHFIKNNDIFGLWFKRLESSRARFCHWFNSGSNFDYSLMFKKIKKGSDACRDMGKGPLQQPTTLWEKHESTHEVFVAHNQLPLKGPSHLNLSQKKLFQQEFCN